MKVTFLIPPAVNGKAPERLFGCNFGLTFQPNIFMLYPAAILEKEGHEVRFLDCPIEKIDDKKLEEMLKIDDSDIYIFYTPFLAEEVDKKWARKIREIKGISCSIIFFGPEPTSKPEKFLIRDICPSKTYVVRGEAEKTMPELIDWLEKMNKDDGSASYDDLKKIDGVSWKDIRKFDHIKDEPPIIHNPPRELIENLDEIPFPARHLITKKERYYNPKLKGRPITVALTSRQCWGNCIYCIPCSYMFAREIEGKRAKGVKPPVRLRSPQNIFEEFKQIKDEGYKAVAIIDDNFMGFPTKEGRERIKEICRLIKPLGIEWGCLARADTVEDEETLKAMKDAGCVYVDIGVESFDQKVLDYVHKGIKAGDNFIAILLLQKVGIEPKLNILFGASPYETEENMKWTVEVLKKLNVDWISFDVVIPHRDTEFYKIVKENNWFATKSKDFEPADPMREATVDFPNMSHEKLAEMVKWAYRSYYLRPRYVWKRLSKLTSLHELNELIGTVRRLFK